MTRRSPRPAASAAPARWLTNRIDLWGPDRVANLVGSDFAAYARVFHPLDDQPGSPTWAAVARGNGRTMYPSAHWEKISAPTPLGSQNAHIGRSQPGDPMPGELNTWALEALCASLAWHTTTPQTCYFAVWGGWGWLPNERHRHTSKAVTAYYAPDGALPNDLQLPAPAPADWQLDLGGPTFALPDRDDYYLFVGHLDEAAWIGHWVTETFFVPQSPQFFWPADHTWCVATEIDDDSTFVGGSRALIDELCGSETIEVLQIAPDATFDDRLNP